MSIREGNVILLVEDDDSHAVLIERILKRNNLNKQLVRLRNGREALDALFSVDSQLRQNTFAIILDLHMPEISGFEVLRMVRHDGRTNHLPVIILSANQNQQELNRCLLMGADLTMTKGGSHQAFSQTVGKIVDYLMEVKLDKPVA